MIGKTVLHEVLDINRRTIYPSPHHRPTSASPLSFEWIYKNKICSHNDVAALISADVNEHVLVDAISKLKIDISKVAVRPQPSLQTDEKLQLLDRDIEKFVRLSDLDRATILDNLKLIDNTQRRFFNNRSSASSPSASPMTAAGEKPSIDATAQKNALTRLALDRSSLQQTVDALDDLDLEAEAVRSALAAIRDMPDDNAAMAATQIDALCKQIAVKRDNIEFVEHNMMRDRHFILEKLGAKREEIKQLEDRCDEIFADLRRTATKQQSSPQPPPKQEPPVALDSYAFDRPVYGVRVFEEDMSMYSNKSYSHRDDISIHDLNKDNIRTFVKDAVRHDFKKHVGLRRSPKKQEPVAADKPKPASTSKGFLSPQPRKRMQAT